MAFDFATANHFRAVVFLVLCGIVLFAPGPQYSGDRPRRGAVRAGNQADGRERRFRRHPLPGRRPLQEAGWHLLDAGGGGGNRLGARPAAGAIADLALSNSLADRRHRRGAAHLLDGACLRHTARGRAGGVDDVQFRPARRRSPASPRRTQCCCWRSSPRWGRWRGSDPVLATRRRSGAPVLDGAGGVLDGARRRHPAQGPADPDVRWRYDHGARNSSTVRRHGCGGCARSGA